MSYIALRISYAFIVSSAAFFLATIVCDLDHGQREVATFVAILCGVLGGITLITALLPRR